jgi:protein phosphatase
MEDLFSKHFGPSPPPVRVTFGSLTHQGLVRTNNEDHFMVVERRRTRSVLFTNLPAGVLSAADDVAYLYAVADGMGGAVFGEMASMLALRSGFEQASGAIKWSWIINDREVQDLKERVEICFKRMSDAIVAKATEDPQFAGMGTTLTAVYSVGMDAFIGHVGDSRGYLMHDGTLTRITRDHTLAQQCLDAGLPVPSRSWYYTLTNWLGARDQNIRVEFHHLHLAAGDQVLLCTDGLSDPVKDDEIAAILGRGLPAQQAVQTLVDLALQRGGKDNITAVLAQYASV